MHAGVGVAILALRGVRMRVGVHACSGAHGACAHALVEEREHVGRVCRRSVEAHGGVEFGRHEVLGVGDLTRSTLQASPIMRINPNTTDGTLAASRTQAGTARMRRRRAAPQHTTSATRTHAAPSALEGGADPAGGRREGSRGPIGGRRAAERGAGGGGAFR